MNVMRRPVLQLNASYEALRIIPAMRALKLVTTGKATVELATKTTDLPRYLFAERYPAAGVQACSRSAAGYHAPQHSYEGCVPLSILRTEVSWERVDARSCNTQSAGRKELLGEPGSLLPKG